jgi:DeoR/GlpR family transcriptional regulator of sugar metabolism
MLISARTAAVVADHMKFERTTPVRVPNFDRATHVITDAPPETRLRSLLEGRGTKVVVAREVRAEAAQDRQEP